jgi:hypothetical protein
VEDGIGRGGARLESGIQDETIDLSIYISGFPDDDSVLSYPDRWPWTKCMQLSTPLSRSLGVSSTLAL